MWIPAPTSVWIWLIELLREVLIQSPNRIVKATVKVSKTQQGDNQRLRNAYGLSKWKIFLLRLRIAKEGPGGPTERKLRRMIKELKENTPKGAGPKG